MSTNLSGLGLNNTKYFFQFVIELLTKIIIQIGTIERCDMSIAFTISALKSPIGQSYIVDFYICFRCDSLHRYPERSALLVPMQP